MENRKRKADFSSKDIVSAIEKEYPIPSPTENREEDTLREKQSIFLSRIEKHYESSAPSVQDLSKLKPRDLPQSWNDASYKDSRLRLAIMGLAPSVVSVSYFVDCLDAHSQRKVDCTGFIIDWDDSKGIATVLTSAKLMRSLTSARSPSNRDNYYIIVRLTNGKMLLAKEDYVDYYHNIVTFKVNSDAKLRPLDLYSPLENLDGVEVLALAREFDTCKLSESCGLFRKDYPYFGCEQLASSTCSSSSQAGDGEGGPLITKAGQIIGINFFDGNRYLHPLPTSVISLCLRNWNSHGIVMQPWLGFTVIDIANLPLEKYETYETMHEFSGDSSVVVKEVYKGSPADKVGVRSGDSINVVSMNGRKLKFCGLQEYAKLLNDISDMLSACHPNQTDTMVSVSVNDNRKLVRAENLSVDDKKFCSSWLDDWTPKYQPTVAGYSPTRPGYSPTVPTYSHTGPTYSPTAVIYSPIVPGSSPSRMRIP